MSNQLVQVFFSKVRYIFLDIPIYCSVNFLSVCRKGDGFDVQLTYEFCFFCSFLIVTLVNEVKYCPYMTVVNS